MGTEQGRLDRVVNELGEVHQYDYDKDGNCIQEVAFDGRVIRYVYDAVGLCVRNE
jgi:YD repeat-containing protein